MRKLPIILIYSRLVIGLFIILLSLLGVNHYSLYAVILLTIGLLTDIFDGIIARKLGISTPNLRRLDSSIDQAFFISVLIATFIECPPFFKANAYKLIIILAVEIAAYIVCFIKFKKEIATHSIGAKIWTLFLFATLVQVIFTCDSVLLFNICFWLGLITRLEIIGIILLLRNWTNDVPTIFHALQLRQGKVIKRNKLFNG